MSGKFEANNSKKRKNGGILWKVIVLILALIALGAAVLFLISQNEMPEGAPAAAEQPNATVPAETSGAETEKEEQPMTFALDHGLVISKIGGYTGAYMEDGSDEVVSDVLMIMLTNSGDEYIQYAEIILTGENGNASFSFSTLYPGDSVVLLEKNRTAASDDVYLQAEVTNVAVFEEIPDLCQDKVEIQVLDGVINITNISGEPITGDVMIYYKNRINGLYYGGITYRVKVTGGMEVDEIKQLVADHFSADGSEIMFVTCG